MIYIEQANTLSYDEVRMPDAQILRGDVVFRHESTYMYCDSAYFYETSNSMTAMGHVRMVQGDSLSGTGNILYYNGNTRLARLRNNCRLEHHSTVLLTDSCNYDRARDVAYYFGGGTIIDREDTLTSVRGKYIPSTRMATFSDSVHLINPKFILDSDTLLYHTETHRTDLISPTRILYDGKTTITSSNGWYNTETELSTLYDRSLIYHHDGRTVTADTIYYDKKNGYGHLCGSMVAVDTTHSTTLTGHHGEVWEERHRGYATDSALLVDWSDSLSYMYLHADTLFTEDLPVSDTLPDSTYHRVRGYHRVRLYREDVQFVCDSMVYMGNDSIMYLYTDPVCWNENNQVSADSVRLYLVNGKVDKLKGIGNSITIQQGERDSTCFNQMAGKQMEAFIHDGEMDEVFVSGNAETIFYPENDTSYIGMNTTQSSYVRVYMHDRKVRRVRFTAETTGTMYPMDQIPSGKDRLTPYFWASHERPRSPEEVFLRPERTPRPKAGLISATDLDDEEEKEEDANKQSKRRNDSDRNRKTQVRK